jgi:hypothetical protein
VSRLVWLIPVAAAATIPVTLTMPAIGISLRSGGYYLGPVFLVSHYRFGSGGHRISLSAFGSCVPALASFELS